jgi:hypothetical protein
LEALTVLGHPGQVALSFWQASQDLTYLDVKKRRSKTSGQLTKGLAAASVHCQIRALPEQCAQDPSSLEDIF